MKIVFKHPGGPKVYSSTMLEEKVPTWQLSMFKQVNIKHKTKGKIQVQFLRLSTLGSSIEFKHMITLTNETQIMLSFPRIFKFSVFEFNQEPNALDLRNCT